MTIQIILLLFFAGIGGGIVNGLIGASTVVIITPLLSTFAGYSPYTAIGISLATDVFASLTTAKTYHRYGNVDLKDSMAISIIAVITALIGSFLSSGVPDSGLGVFAGIATCLMGIQFLRNPISVQVKNFRKKINFLLTETNTKIITYGFGVFIGFNCGVLGAGGGIVILVVLTFVLGYDTKLAVGTAVIIMSLTATSGAITHFIMDGFSFRELLICGPGAIIGAYFSSNKANNIEEAKLSKIIGSVFLILGSVMTIDKINKLDI